MAAEVGADDRRIVSEIFGSVFASYGSILDQIATIRYFQAQLGVLLDEQDAKAADGDPFQRFEQILRQQRRHTYHHQGLC